MYLRTLVLILLVLTPAIPVSAQIAVKTGTIFGRVLDEAGKELPGVSVQLESTTMGCEGERSGPHSESCILEMPVESECVGDSVFLHQDK